MNKTQERWLSLDTRPELAEAARRLRQLSHSRPAQLSIYGSQAVHSLSIGFSWVKSALVVERAHYRPSPNSIATYSHAASNRETVALRWVRADQRAAYTLQLRGYNAGAGSPTHPPMNGPSWGPIL